MKICDYQTAEDRRSVRISTDEGSFRICGIGDGIIRCVYTRREEDSDVSPIGVNRMSVPLSVEELENGLEISTEKLTLWIDREDGRFVWTKRENGEILLEEGEKELTETPYVVWTTGDEKPVICRVKTVDGERNFVENLKPVQDHTAYHAKLSFRLRPEEKIHGLGQGEEGIYDYRGHVQYLYQHNMRIPVPFLMSDQGYAVLVDCGSLMTWNDDERGTYLWCDSVEQLDYYFCADDSADGLIDCFRKLTGRCAMLPKWAFGYVQSKERYDTQEELVETAQRYRNLGIGLDCVVQDWKTWPDDDWGCKILDKKRYPDIRRATDRLHDLHVHAMVSVWPNMNAGTRDYEEMEQNGFLLNDLATYDAFSEKARDIYWKQCERELFSGGFDAWWCDSTEPFSGPDWNGEHRREPWERFRLVGEEHKKFLGADRANLYAAAHAKGIFENQRKAAPDKRVLNLTRSGYAGIQKYGTMLWSGDISARWDVMRAQIAEGLNMSMSGLPYWTLDIGAFFVVHRNWKHRGCGCDTDPSMKWFWHGDYEEAGEDPAYRELYTRWFEFGSFLPMFRSHGTDTPREIWHFGEKGTMFYDALSETVRTRYRLMPYIYSMAGAVVQQNETMMRSLLFDFPDDPKAASCGTEYMFGRSLLICPVTEPMYYEAGGVELDVPHRWTVYLPDARDGSGRPTGWYDFYTHAYYEGGREVTVDAPIDHIPVFVREGSIIPEEENLLWADEKAETPLHLHLYPRHESGNGNDSFLWYEDTGDGYGYEKGEFNQIEISFDEKTGCLSLGSAGHQFTGGLAGRKIIAEAAGLFRKEFVYSGEEMSVPCRI